MKIPDKIKIFGLTYEIIKSDRNQFDGVDSSGSINSFHQRIWIDNTAHQECQEATLIHEVIEAINTKNDLKMDHTQISSLAVTLHQVLKENRFLKEE